MQTRALPSGRIVLAAALALPLFLTACDNEGIDTPPPTIPVASPGFARDLLAGRVAVPVKVVDARTGTVLSVPVSLRVSDDDAGQDFHETNGLDSNNGLITLMLKPGVTAAGPVALRLIAQAEGYFTGGAAVELDANAGEVLIQVVSMTAGAQPEGVAVASQAGVTAAADGALQTAINLNAEATNAAANGASATFALPAGTVLRDADGNALSGALTVDIAYFSPTTDESRAAFPGGFSPGTVMDAGGNPSEGYFITAGFLAVDIVDASGRKAHLLSQPASMTIQIPAGTHNPETGNPVAAGDTIPVWSHDERSGQWSHEQVATVVAAADGSGNFEVTFTVNHLSYWNLGWYSESTCDPTLNFTGITEMPKDGLFVEATIAGNFYHDSTVLNDLSNQIRVMPTDTPITLTAFAERHGVPLGSVVATVGSTCDAIVLPINASLLPPPPRYLDVTFMIEAPRSWKLAQLGQALTEAGLDSEEQAEVLEYTHGFDPSRTYVVDDAFYAKLAEVGATALEIDRVRVFMSLRIKPQNGRLDYMLSDYSIHSAEIDTNGQLRIRLPEGSSAWITACYVGGYVSGTWTEVYNPACGGYEYYGADPAVARVDLPATASSVTITLASTQFVVNSALAVLAEYGVDR